jgi:DNA-binding protein H-NS
MRRKEKTEERERDHQAAQERERNSEHAERERDRAREVHNTYRERVRSTEINRESYIQFSSSIVSEKPKFLVKAWTNAVIAFRERPHLLRFNT